MNSKDYLTEFIKCKNSFEYFCSNYIKVYNPEDGLVNFNLYPFQIHKVFPAFENDRFVILKKFRQGGLSTLASIYSLWKCIFCNDQKIMMISITDRDAKNLMQMIHGAWENLPEWLQCETKEFNQHNLVLENGSSIKCGTSKMGRGFSSGIIIVDEAAFIPQMEEVWKAIFPTISAGGEKSKAFIISTTHGLGNWYSDTYHDAVDGHNDFTAIDLSYTEHPKYNNEKYVTTMKKQLGEKGFNQEVLGKFLGSSDTFISEKDLENLDEYIKSIDPPNKYYNEQLWVWEEPIKNRNYIVCGDVAEGLGENHDYDAFHVIDMATLNQVAEFYCNNINTIKFAKILNEVGKKYNNALMIIENNSLGVGVLERLFEDLEYENIHWSKTSKRSEKKGFTMSNKTRPLLLDTLSNCFDDGSITLRSSRLLHELQSFVYNTKKRKVEARSNRHDDLIISLAMGLFVRNHLATNLIPSIGENVKEEEYKRIFNPDHDSVFNENNKLNLNNKDNLEKNNINNLDCLIVDTNGSDPEYISEEELLSEFGWI